MDEGATQTSTQPFLDPRRRGNSSMLSEEDESDVVCILHPGSPAAYRAVGMIAEASPQHILQNQGLSLVSKTTNEIDSRDAVGLEATNSRHQEDVNQEKARVGPRGNFESGCHAMDIALRLSSPLLDPCMGFTFGRRARRCDMVISAEDEYAKMVSGMHFRIYLNKSGVLMLEDTSTNGTIVDSIPLKGGEQSPEYESKRMLNSGAIIEILLDPHEIRITEVMKFIVKVPSRDHVADRWRQNLAKYMAWLDQTERQAAAFAQAQIHEKAITMPPHIPFNILGDGLKPAASSGSDIARNLAVGIEKYNFGMEWNGGDIYNVVGYIGRGAFANVYKLATKRDGEIFAAKQLEKRRFIKNNILDHKINNEMLIMKNLSHPNIVAFVGHHDAPQHLYIIMEFVPGGDLTSFINSGTAMAEYMCQLVSRQICEALEYLHCCNITHRDIKPDNILIKTRDPLVVKLSDFGLSKVITNEDTFLKSFCGTLLYCAPEIYPGYDLYKRGVFRKRQRACEPPPKTLPYKQSVDIWAFGAVLYHLLCGSPPYRGSSEDRGAEMLNNVMSKPVDYGRLKNAGVSETGIDFVSKMIVHDPGLRSTEAQCLQHPWIAKSTNGELHDMQMNGSIRTLGAIKEDMDELDASQLSLHENPRREKVEDGYQELKTEIDEIEAARPSKRYKSVGQSTQYSSLSGSVIYPLLPSAQADSTPVQPGHPGTNRLFGEIGASALRSSGVLGYDAHTALEIPVGGSCDEDFNISDSQISDYVSDGHAATSRDAPVLSYHPRLSGPAFVGSAPSLFGAEALVDQLNMASPESGASATSLEGTQVVPRTPGSQDASPPGASAVFATNQSSQVAPSASDQTTPKQVKTARSATLSPRRRVNLDVSKSYQSRTAQTGDGGPGDGQNPCTGAKLPDPSAIAYAMGKKLSEKEEHKLFSTNAGAASKSSEENVSMPQKANRTVSRSQPSAGSTFAYPSSGTPSASSSFTKPPPRFGTLTALAGSICSTTIKLEQRITSYGRDPQSHVRHDDAMEARIPKNALDIIFWRPGLEGLMDSGKEWSTVEDLHAIVHTRTSQNIKVNGVKLTKGDGCWNYGRLHTGDVITIFGPPDGEKAGGKAAEFLKFRCEFGIGLSAKPREGGGPPFVVEKEEEKFMQNQMRRSRQGSRDSDASSIQEPKRTSTTAA